MIKEDKSNRIGLFYKISERIVVLFHFCDYLMDGVEQQYNKVHHKEGPEHINLNGFKIGAEDGKNKCTANAFPDLELPDCGK